jgi:S-(hydroxymethyl)glutathione dehydrogenase / alcohol dehydrogenase
VVAAAVLTALGEPLEIWDDIEVSAPSAGEVLVRMVASGVCHTDLSMSTGALPPGPLPIILGHEGSGTVVSVGEGVRGIGVGDPVVLSWLPCCGTCYFCSRGQPFLCGPGQAASSAGSMLDGGLRARRGSSALRQMSSIGTFSEMAVVPAGSVVRLPETIDIATAALLGCGVLTGVGAAMRTARVESGDAVVVLGCGGVGLNVIQGARLRGAETIIAVDTEETKLAIAKTFGATHTVTAGEADVVAEVRALTDGRGADVAFEVVGASATIDQAVRATRRGGQAVLVGVPDVEVRLVVRALTGIVAAGRTITGCWYGSSDPHRDVPAIVDLYHRGELYLDELISRRIPLKDVNDALASLNSGQLARTLIEY